MMCICMYFKSKVGYVFHCQIIHVFSLFSGIKACTKLITIKILTMNSDDANININIKNKKQKTKHIISFHFIKNCTEIICEIEILRKTIIGDNTIENHMHIKDGEENSQHCGHDKICNYILSKIIIIKIQHCQVFLKHATQHLRKWQN